MKPQIPASPDWHTDANDDYSRSNAAVKGIEAGWYVLKSGEAFMCEGAGVRWFDTAAPAMAATDSGGEFSWLDYGYKPGKAIEPEDNDDALKLLSA